MTSDNLSVFENESSTYSKFISGTEIPLYNGLDEEDANVINFDNEYGSISSAIYKIKTTPEDVRKFYIETMPGLGFDTMDNEQNESVLTFSGSNADIELKFTTNDLSENFVNFTVTPSKK